MSAVLTTPVDICNAALGKLGAGIRLGSLLDGSVAGKIALDTYGQTRDKLLRDGNWGFARRDAVMVLLKSAPAGGYAVTAWNSVTHPPLPWKYAYRYPADCLKVRSIRRTPVFLPEFDPQPVVFDTPNTVVVATEQKVIVTQVASAVLTYTGQVVDPALWEASFVQVMVDAMAEIFAPTLGRNPQAQQIEDQMEVRAETEAAVVQG
ncbi:MAG: hypothetical protein WCP82_07290 [Alphaproteobacteria bacterium]